MNDYPFNTWAFLAGLGIFLLGMIMIEGALSILGGRPFKKFLRKYTNHPIKAILSGTIVTAVLQSSSVVSLMVLALVGAGIIELYNALGIILGSNLGTTFTGWIVAYFGFKFDIESFALPFIAVGALIMAFFPGKEKLYNIGNLVGGFGFLFLGLEYMKSSIELLAQNFDLEPFIAYGPYLLFFVGFILTAVIQSSSAVMVIALSALNAGVIPLVAAAAMVIGSDLGTTITVIFGGIKGTPAKKRVALGQFLFNLIVDILALAFLYPLLHLVTKVYGLSDPLMALVAFHSTFNVLGILLFLPFLKLFSRFLNRRFTKEEEHVAQFINHVPTNVPEIAIESLRKEIQHLIERVFLLQISILEMEPQTFNYNVNSFLKEESKHSPIIQYEKIKELEGELVEFYVSIQNEQLERDDSIRLKQLILSIRYAMNAAKGVKDVSHNVKDFYRSVNDHLTGLFGVLKIQQQSFFLDLDHLFRSDVSANYFEGLTDLKKSSKRNYNAFLERAYVLVKEDQLAELEISTLFNVNRELYNSNKGLILAIKELLLKGQRAGDFDVLSEVA